VIRNADLLEARAKIARHRGEAPAEKIFADAFARASLTVKDLYSPAEVMALAEGLIPHGGFVELVGRSLKMRALLAGAAPNGA
jgi:hypothetical protein